MESPAVASGPRVDARSQPEAEAGSWSGRRFVLEGVEALDKLFVLTGSSKLVSVVDGATDSLSGGAGVLDGGAVAVLCLSEGLAGIGESVSEPEAADGAGLAVSGLEPEQFGAGVDDFGLSIGYGLLVRRSVVPGSADGSFGGVEWIDGVGLDVSSVLFEVSADGDGGDVGRVGGWRRVERRPATRRPSRDRRPQR